MVRRMPSPRPSDASVDRIDARGLHRGEEDHLCSSLCLSSRTRIGDHASWTGVRSIQSHSAEIHLSVVQGDASNAMES